MITILWNGWGTLSFVVVTIAIFVFLNILQRNQARLQKNEGLGDEVHATMKTNELTDVIDSSVEKAMETDEVKEPKSCAEDEVSVDETAQAAETRGNDATANAEKAREEEPIDFDLETICSGPLDTDATESSRYAHELLQMTTNCGYDDKDAALNADLVVKYMKDISAQFFQEQYFTPLKTPTSPPFERRQSSLSSGKRSPPSTDRLPLGVTAHVDPMSERTFFYNTITGLSSWNPPKRSVSFVNPPKPEGYSIHESPSGKLYFYSLRTGESMWQVQEQDAAVIDFTELLQLCSDRASVYVSTMMGSTGYCSGAGGDSSGANSGSAGSGITRSGSGGTSSCGHSGSGSGESGYNCSTSSGTPLSVEWTAKTTQRGLSTWTADMLVPPVLTPTVNHTTSSIGTAMLGTNKTLPAFRSSFACKQDCSTVLRLLVNEERRHDYDMLLQRSELLQTIHETANVRRHSYKPVWPFAPRDCILLTSWWVRPDHSFVVASLSPPDHYYPHQSGYVRCAVPCSVTVIQPTSGDSNAKCIVTHMIHVDLKNIDISIPAGIKDLLAMGLYQHSVSKLKRIFDLE